MKKSLCLLATICSLALVQSAQARKPENFRGPPQEAIDACQGANQGDGCNMQGRHGEDLTGACENVPSGEFACVPEHHHKKGRGGGKGDRKGPPGGPGQTPGQGPGGEQGRGGLEDFDGQYEMD